MYSVVIKLERIRLELLKLYPSTDLLHGRNHIKKERGRFMEL